METQIGWMWGVLAAVFSACTGGFFFLNNRLNKLSDHIDTSRAWVDSFNKLAQDVREIKIFLKGDFDKNGQYKDGLVHIVRDMKKDVEILKEKVGA